MNREKKLLPEIVITPDEPNVDVKEGDKILIAANLSGRKVKRSPDELNREWSPGRVDRAEDLGGAFGLCLGGSYEGPDGEEVPVSMPVKDEESFTPGGLVDGIPGLFRTYVKTRTCEEAARYLAEKHRAGLEDEEVDFLETTAGILEAADEEEPS